MQFKHILNHYIVLVRDRKFLKLCSLEKMMQVGKIAFKWFIQSWWENV